MMFKKIVLTIVLFSMFIGGNAFAEKKESIQIKGSDTMVNLGQAWAEEFTKKYPQINVAVTGGGSGTGIASLINGTCDIAESSRSIKDKEIKLAQGKGIEPKEHIVGMDGIAVVVHPSNPVKNLTMGQLRGIFMGTIKNWKEAGGKDARIVLLSREVNSGTHVFFKEHVLRQVNEIGPEEFVLRLTASLPTVKRQGDEKGPEEFAPEALLMSSSQAIADEITQNNQAIGYYGMGYISQSQKVVAIAKDTNSPWIEPLAEKIVSGEYPISRPLFMYTKGEPEGAVKTFMDFVFSKEGQEIVKKIDFVPVR